MSQTGTNLGLEVFLVCNGSKLQARKTKDGMAAKELGVRWRKPWVAF